MSNGTEIPLQGCLLFRKFWKMLFHSHLEMSGNLNRNFALLTVSEREVANWTVRNLR